MTDGQEKPRYRELKSRGIYWLLAAAAGVFALLLYAAVLRFG